jgi:hypothetical protein
MSKVHIPILAALLCCIAAAPTNCPGGAKEGETLERGRTWYECKSGELIEKGCLSEQKKRLNPSETFHNGGYVFECYKDDSGRFNTRAKGCLSQAQDKDYMPNDTWQDENYWYKCTMEGDRPTVTIEGCVDNGKRVNIGESINKAGDLIYTCKHQDNGNTGFEITPNKDKNVEYKKEDDHIQKIQNVPTFINT